MWHLAYDIPAQDILHCNLTSIHETKTKNTLQLELRIQHRWPQRVLSSEIIFYCPIWRFGYIYRFHHHDPKVHQARNTTAITQQDHLTLDF